MSTESVERSDASRTPKTGQAWPPWKERVLRGYALWGSPLGQKIEHQGKGVYSVPSCSGQGSYEVDLKVFTDEPESCNCPDWARPCKHLIAATIHRAKARMAARRAQAVKTEARASGGDLADLGAAL